MWDVYESRFFVVFSVDNFYHAVKSYPEKPMLQWRAKKKNKRIHIEGNEGDAMKTVDFGLRRDRENAL